MPLKMIVILIISSVISACSSTQRVLPVLVPAKPYVGTVKYNSIIKCPEPVQKEVYQHLRKREHYIETLLDVIEAHNGVSTSD